MYGYCGDGRIWTDMDEFGTVRLKCLMGSEKYVLAGESVARALDLPPYP